MFSIGLSLTGRLKSSGFSPTSLFSAGEQGIWLEPSDLTTMFTDRAGTTPVTTPGQTVGLRLDKSKGLVLGSELVTNGDFSNPVTTGWVAYAGASLSVEGARLKVTSTGGNPFALYAISTVANKWYSFAVSYDAAAHAGQLTTYPASNTAGSPLATMANVTGSGTRTGYFMATGTSSYVLVQGLGVTSGVSVFFDNISVKELPGNHAVAPTDAARPTYGIEPKTGRRNLLTFSEEFDNAAWTKAGVTVAANNATAPNDTTTADTLTSTATSNALYVSLTGTAVRYTASAYFKAGTDTSPLLLLATLGSGAGGAATFNLTAVTATTVNYGATTGTTATITSVGSGWYRCTLSVTLTAATYYCQVSLSATALTLAMWGAQLELGSTATAYQRVDTAFDVTEAGVPTVHYVQYDGTDDSFSTSSIDFTATDKMSVFAGFRRLDSTNSLKVLVELSAATASNNGSFYLSVPEDSGPTPYSGLGAYLRGTGTMSRYGTLSYPTNSSYIETLLFDLSRTTASTAITPRVNGVDGYQNSSSTGTNTATTFGNYPLFIGRRNNATAPFNGRDYGIIIVGKTASATEITNTESYLAANTSGVSI